MDKYVCTVCGYIYDPTKGDPEHGQPPGTAFENLPYDWVCPECSVPKSDFLVHRVALPLLTEGISKLRKICKT